ncbi:hypothetical protein OAO87_02395 [bacterium]|nr:hypothetical protein [bacterium]
MVDTMGCGDFWKVLLPASSTAGKAAARPRPPPAGAELPDTTIKTVDAYAAMKASDSLVPFQYDLPSTMPPDGFVDIAITHCGICHSDIHQIDDAWQGSCFPPPSTVCASPFHGPFPTTTVATTTYNCSLDSLAEPGLCRDTRSLGLLWL